MLLEHDLAPDCTSWEKIIVKSDWQTTFLPDLSAEIFRWGTRVSGSAPAGLQTAQALCQRGPAKWRLSASCTLLPRGSSHLFQNLINSFCDRTEMKTGLSSNPSSLCSSWLRIGTILHTGLIMVCFTCLLLNIWKLRSVSIWLCLLTKSTYPGMRSIAHWMVPTHFIMQHTVLGQRFVDTWLPHISSPKTSPQRWKQTIVVKNLWVLYTVTGAKRPKDVPAWHCVQSDPKRHGVSWFVW